MFEVVEVVQGREREIRRGSRLLPSNANTERNALDIGGRVV